MDLYRNVFVLEALNKDREGFLRGFATPPADESDGAPAVGLDLAVKWLKTSSGASEFLVGLLTWTKYTIAVLDALLYVVFMVNMAWRFMNELR